MPESYGPDDVTKLRSENERLRTVLRYFVGCAYPVATEINPRGYNWRGEEALDFAMTEAKAVFEGSLMVPRDDALREIAILAEDYETKRMIFEYHAILNTPACADERVKAMVAYHIAQAQMFEAYRRLERAKHGSKA